MLPLIKKLDDRGLILYDFVGDFQSIQRDMEKRDGSGGFRKRKVFSSVFDRYHDAVTTWHCYRKEYDEDYRLEQSTVRKARPADPHSSVFHDSTSCTFQRAGKKVGRNDPCPCGSGKKYKKCCGKP